MVAFVFPADYSNIKLPDEAYLEEYTSLKNLGFNVYLIDVDSIENNSKAKFENITENIIYRGWMLTSDKYNELNKLLSNNLLIKPENYLNSHHLPSWYNSIKDLTIKSIVTNEDNAIEAFKNSGKNKLFIKDYVKSLKTGKGSIIDSIDDVTRAINDMKKYRGFIEGGIVLRDVIDFKENTEKRFFVLNDVIYSNDNDKSSEMFNLVNKVKEIHKEFFYSVDIAEDSTGKLYVIEIGDGQVSDMVGWNLESFTKIFLDLKSNKKLKIN